MGRKVCAVSLACSWVCGAVFTACGSGNDGATPGVAGSSVAGSGVAGSSVAGVAGVAGSSVAGGNALGGQSGATAGSFSGSGGVGAGGSASGGRAGAEGTGIALDPTVAIPSHDCRTDTGANCISVAGTYEGAVVDAFCNAEGDTGVTIQAGKWVIGCEHLMPGFARLFVVIARPGNFSEQVSPGSHPVTGFEFASGASPFGAAALFASNLLDAEVVGSIVAAQSNHRIVSGTLHGKWGPPASDCRSLGGTACVEANLNVTFRLNSEYGYCFSDADCTAPPHCDPVGFACFN